MRSLLASGFAVLISVLPALAADDEKWSAVKGKVVFDDSKHNIPAREFPPAAKGKEPEKPHDDADAPLEFNPTKK